MRPALARGWQIAWSRGGKRAAKSVARTKAWLARCMARAGELSGTLLLGSVVGAGSTRYRTESAHAVMQHDAALGGTHIAFRCCARWIIHDVWPRMRVRCRVLPGRDGHGGLAQ